MAKRTNTGIPGLSFSLKRALGITQAKRDFTNSTGRTITALYVKSSDVEDFDDNNLIAEPFNDGEVRQFQIDVDGMVYDLRVVYDDGTVNDINDVFLGYITAASFVFEYDLSSLEYSASTN